MPITVQVTDSLVSGQVLKYINLLISSTQTSARQLIEGRIRQEVEHYNQSEQLQKFNGLVQPTEAEATLNGYGKTLPKRQIDADAQCKKALDAFERNGFFLLLDDRQVTDLDAELHVSEVSTVQFIKLVPLVGG